MGLETRCLPNCYYKRGLNRWLKGEYADAIQDITESIRLDPKRANAYVTRGLAWQDLGEYRKAIADCNLAIRQDPDSADAYHNRGNNWVELGKFRKAIADFTCAIDRDPKSAVSFNSRGVAWSRRGRYAEALADYERAFELEPDSADRRFILGGFLAVCPHHRYRDGQRALRLMTEVCELSDYSDADHLDYLAAAHAEQGDFSSAIAIQQRSLSLAVEDDHKEWIQYWLELYKAGEPWRLESPKWWQRWV